MAKTQIIYGSPGTGKTRRLVEITRNFELRGLKTLYCSHTKAAAQEAISRWGKPSPNLNVSTIHAFGFKVAGLSRLQVVTDLEFMNFAESLGIDDDDAKLCNEIISYARGTFMSPIEAYDKSSRPVSMGKFASLIHGYSVWKDSNGFADFNDMLIRAAEAKELPRYDALVVDEAQDLTPLHWAVVRNFLCCNPEAQCVVAGDGNQALYEWSGADPQGMEKFCEERSGEIKELEQSYRVPGAVHELALKIAGRLTKGGPTNYKPRVDDRGLTIIGNVDTWADSDSVKFSLEPDRDSLILYSNKFIRGEIEEDLIEGRVLYNALGGGPSPAQTKAGQAMLRAMKTPPDAPNMANATDLEIIYRGLRPEFTKEWSVDGPIEILKRLWRGDTSVLNTRLDQEQYFREVDWTKPIKTRISTIHGSKGHEAQDVHLINSLSTAAQDHAIQNPDALHRLMYVAVTRASERLFIYSGDQPYDFF